ncbi:MAG: hypothetical protein OIF38_03120, partial [Cellvibrionaceae bacterium]|nr:hypothetical protein [Cellvibrionaceae bacterium]
MVQGEKEHTEKIDRHPWIPYLYIMTKKALIEENQRLRERNTMLGHELAQLKKLVFGSRSERNATLMADNQLGLFGDISDKATVEAEKETLTYQRSKKKHPGRNALPEDLPVREVIIEPEGDTTGLQKIGQEVTETLEYTPASLVKRRTIRPKYAKKDGNGVLIAP